MVKIPKEDKRVLIPWSEVERAILAALGARNRNQLPVDQQSWLDTILTEMGPMLRVVMPNQAPQGANIVAVMKQGSPDRYKEQTRKYYEELVK